MPDQSAAIDIFNMLDCTAPLLVYVYLCVLHKEKICLQKCGDFFLCVCPDGNIEQGLAELVGAVFRSRETRQGYFLRLMPVLQNI